MMSVSIKRKNISIKKTLVQWFLPSTGHNILLFTAISYCAMMFTSTCAQEPYNVQRNRMVKEQIIARGISDTHVIMAMQRIERHLFVPAEYVQMAYKDRPLPIGYGQTISQPYIVAFMTDILKLKSGDRVLEIGTGSGYQAALLAEICDSVFSIEVHGHCG